MKMLSVCLTFRRIFSFASLLAIVLLPSSLYAQYAGDIYSAPTLGMGGTGRASAGDGSALDLNPAALSAQRSYQVSSSYRLYATHKAHSFGISFVDSLTSKLASGVGWTYGWASAVPGPPPVGWIVVDDTQGSLLVSRAQDYKIGFALPLQARVALGSTLVWYRHKSDDPEVLDEALPEKQFSFHIGTLVMISQMLSVGLVGTNLVPTGDKELPTLVAAGLRAGPPSILAVALDVEADLSDRLQKSENATQGLIYYDLHVGAQGVISQHFPIRLGYYTRKLDQSKYLTAGVGIEGGKTRIGYALRYPLNGAETEGGIHPLFHLFFVSVSMP